MDLALQSRLHSIYEQQIPMMGGAMAGGRRKRRSYRGGAGKMSDYETKQLISNADEILKAYAPIEEEKKAMKFVRSLKKKKNEEKRKADMAFEAEERRRRQEYNRAKQGRKYEKMKEELGRYTALSGEYKPDLAKYFEEENKRRGISGVAKLAQAQAIVEAAKGRERATRLGLPVGELKEPISRTLSTTLAGLGFRRKHKSGARNPWIAHVKAYQRKHPHMSYAEAMQRAKSSYRGSALVGGDYMDGGRRRRRTKKHRSHSVGSRSSSVLKYLLGAAMAGGKRRRKKKAHSLY